jgi:hypothetical protein
VKLAGVDLKVPALSTHRDQVGVGGGQEDLSAEAQEQREEALALGPIELARYVIE